jgi:hypothetical protein
MGLQKFGNNFLGKFQCAEMSSEILKNVTIVDSPGVLSGEQQRIGRNYHMTEVCQWFAERSDIILLIFDAHKLDISDELKDIIDHLRGYDDKIRYLDTFVSYKFLNVSICAEWGPQYFNDLYREHIRGWSEIILTDDLKVMVILQEVLGPFILLHRHDGL